MQYQPETNYYNASINRVNNAKKQGILTHHTGDGEGSHLLCEEIPERGMASV
jgi:hypothetical protein